MKRFDTAAAKTDRRTFAKLYAGFLTALSLPAHIRAKAPLSAKGAFLKSLEEKPWLLGYLGTPESELQGTLKIVSGRVPPGLQGHFFRNGPARHDIGPDRFAHWFDAPGMVQRFTFANNGVTHRGRLIDTARNAVETKAGGIRYTGFGTHAHNLGTGGSADSVSPANISLTEHAGELLALWEGGSPHIIDPETLETKGRKAWSDSTKGLPFGAHPRIDKDGSMWNTGYSVNPSALILYHIKADGVLAETRVIPQSATPMIHDFMITETKILIVAPPYTADPGEARGPDGAFIDHFKWHGKQATQILVIEKDDLSKVTRIETDPFWVYHFGNAYDISPTEIGFDFPHHDDPGFMTKDAFAAMDGSWDGTASAASRYVQAKIDLKAKTVGLQKTPELGLVEFIKTDARENLLPHRYALMISQPGGMEEFGFNRLILVDRETGNTVSYDVGDTEILEEHLIVPKPLNPGSGIQQDFWIVGTSLDWKSGVTNVSVYEGHRLAEGPVMKATMDLALPLGLHGTFISL